MGQKRLDREESTGCTNIRMILYCSDGSIQGVLSAGNKVWTWTYLAWPTVRYAAMIASRSASTRPVLSDNNAGRYYLRPTSGWKPKVVIGLRYSVAMHTISAHLGSATV